jgi:hypothetical protein
VKQNVSPVAAVALIVVVVCVAAFFIMRAVRSPAGTATGEKPPGMPPDVAAEFQKRMGTANPTGAGAGVAPSSPMGGHYIPPPGIGGRH